MTESLVTYSEFCQYSFLREPVPQMVLERIRDGRPLCINGRPFCPIDWRLLSDGPSQGEPHIKTDVSLLLPLRPQAEVSEDRGF